jgi:regulator of protease activity HflC (stomatin/prohibitin superfamily)
MREPHEPTRRRSGNRARSRGSHTRQPARPKAESRFQGSTPLSRPGVRRAVTILLGILGLSLIVFVAGARFQRQDIGHVGVVRNGGPLDGRSIRQVLMPGSGVTWAGWFSQKPHEYPSRNIVLLYTVTSHADRGERKGVDVVSVPTRDGVEVGIEGTVFYHFVGESNLDLLRRFDKTFGTREYTPQGGSPLKPYDGEAGFQAMVDNVVRPVIDNDLRRQIGAFQCAEIVTACKLVRRLVPPVNLRGSNRNIALIQNRINASLEDDLAGALGGRFFVDVHFRLVRVSLPVKVQDTVNAAQAASAQVHVAKQELRQGAYEARRNELLAKAYNQSPGLARINAIKSAPRQSTVIINGDSKPQPLILGGK